MLIRASLILLSTLLTEVLGCWSFSSEFPPPSAAASGFERRVRDTMRADYRGDTTRLREIHQAMARDTANAETARWAHYWRGYALWRRSLNLLNEDPKSTEALDDLRVAARDFERAATFPELFAEAESARAACVLSLGAVSGQPDSMRAALRAFVPLLDAAVKAEPDNPRVIWVQSGSTFYKPAKLGGGPDAAIRLMERGLEKSREEGGRPSHPFAPRWGEAEHHMNLAWAWSTRPDPNLDRAEFHGREALQLVPGWHYVRDHLMKQIREARKNVGP